MPKNITEKIKNRMELIMKYLSKAGYATTREIALAYGWRISNTYYVLRVLKSKGYIKETLIGKKAYWHMPEVNAEIEVMEHVRKIFCKLANSHLGNIICIRSKDITAHLRPIHRGYNVADIVTMILDKYGVEYEKFKKHTGKGKHFTVFCMKKIYRSKVCQD